MTCGGQGRTPLPVVPKRLELSARGAWFDGGWRLGLPGTRPVALVPLPVDIIGQITTSSRSWPLVPIRDPQELEEEKLAPHEAGRRQRDPGRPSADVRLGYARSASCVERLRRIQGGRGGWRQRCRGAAPSEPRIEWSHRLLQGRDDRVRTVIPGLLPWGFAVDLVEGSRASPSESFFPFEAACPLQPGVDPGPRVRAAFLGESVPDRRSWDTVRLVPADG